MENEMSQEMLSPETLSKENQELRNALNKTAADLAHSIRELEIESALERVRSRTLVMKESNELNEAVAVLFHQFQALCLFPTEARTYFCHINADTAIAEVWMTHTDGTVMETSHQTPLGNSPSMLQYFEAWKRNEPYIVRNYSGESLREYLKFISSLPHTQADKDYKQLFHSPPEKIVMTDANFLQGNIGIMTFEPLAKEAIDILVRFAKVFEFTYTRFLDLKKAEAQAREAQIELGLERVRARAMAMQNSGELAALVDTIFKELTKLDFAIAMCIINIIDEISLSNMVWGANPDTGKPPDSYYMKFEDYPFHHAMMKGYKERNTKFIYVIEGEEKKIYDEYLFTETEFRKMPMEAQAASRALKKYVASFTFSNFGGLQTVGEEPLSDSNLDILSRFGKVFDLTYTRFNDLKQAEAQARESQIQLALERVRARTMAMQKSEELTEGAGLLFKEVTDLGINSWTAGFNVWSDDNNSYVDYITSPNGGFIEPYTVLTERAEALQDISNARKSGVEFDVQYVEGEKIKQLYIALTGLGEEQFEKMRQDGNQFPSHQYEHFVFGSRVSLMFITYEPVPEAHDIFKRFGKVFEQTYTRFLDLQKAEAQARESQIQLALERVRARTMAMQKSEELEQCAVLLFQQIGELGINAWSAGFSIWQENDTYFIGYNTNPTGGIGAPFRIPLTEDIFFKTIREAKRRGEEFLVFESEGESLVETYRYMDTLPVVGDVMRSVVSAGYELPKYQVTHCGFFSEGHLMFITLEPHPEAWDIFKRFTKVFEQTYTRFIDLQNAEAQARESQIQLALERVRARTMAMQHSEELQDTAILLFKQMKSLGIQTGSCGFNIWERKEKAATVWMSSPEGKIQTPFTLPHTESQLYRQVFEAMENGEDFLVKEIDGETLVKHFDYLLTLPGIGSVIKHLRETGYVFPESMVYHFAFFNSGYLSFHLHKHQPEAHEIFKRFAKVFEQTYTRFLDLQKAEEQARESQIQLAMERVRARTMAMQHSSELADAAMLLFKQMKPLGVPAWSTGYCTWEDDKQAANFWMSSEGLLPSPFKLPLTEEPVFIRYREAYLQGEEFYAAEYSGETLASMYAYMMNFPAVSNMWNRFMDEGSAPIFPTFQINHVVYFAQGFLLFVTHQQIPEAHDIFKRFGKVFEQTYTRFLDLQKAEAQAREAQIEASLERVRSRTMGMQKSEELREVIQLIYEQFLHLNIPLDGAGFAMDYMESDDFNFWLADASSAFPYKVHIPYFEHPQFNRYKEAKEKGVDFYTSSLTCEERNGFFDHISKFIPIPQELKEAVYNAPGYETSHVVLKNVILYILNFNGHSFSDADNATLMRFGKVFEQTYTRFNDLKQAEAQAREAKIEAALEKIRSRSLAMHKSDELWEVVKVVFEKFQELKFSIDGAAFIGTFIEGSRAFNCWLASDQDQSYPTIMKLPDYDTPTLNDLWQAKESGLDFYSKTYSIEEKNPWLRYAFEHTDLKTISDEFKKWMLEQPFLTQSCAFGKNSFIGIHFHHQKTLSEAEVDVLKRFSKVFDQAYIRFLDLQKAEAQTRESQTEAALEKVRSRSMAMQNSNELGEVIQVVFSQFVHLNIAVEHAGFIIDYKKHDDMHIWLADKHLFPSQAVIPYFDSPHWNSFVEAKEHGNNFFTNQHGLEEKNSFYKKLFTLFPEVPQETKDHYLNCPGLAISTVLLDNVGLYIENFDGISFTAEENATLMRFGKVFQQTYTRFQDLQKAEARAKEAKIEAALERTRTQSMLMQRSEQLDETLRVFHEQVLLMGIDSAFSFLWLPDDKNDRHIFWAAWAEEQTNQNPRPEFKSKAINYPLDRQEPATAQCLVDWKSDQRVHTYHVVPADVEGYFLAWAALLEGVEKFKPEYFREGLYYVEAFMKYGCFGVMIAKDLLEDDKKLLGRFAVEFERTYTRFLDLQKAEAQAREAAKQSALDRIRADIASMRTISDLDRITPLIWNELTILGIPFIRCGVFIMDDIKQTIHSFLSTPEGKAIAAFHVPYNNPGNLAPVLEHWRHKKIYTDYWDKKAFTTFADSLVEQGILTSSKQYLSTIPGDGFHLHFLPFLQGMFYVGNTEQLHEGELTMIKSVADAFSTAYARYEDFNRLEAAKQKVDLTLTELKQAQLQLIQAEKMASLGELTAGIAHEIQNPLNFVNNFSDVNKELIAEMKEEIDKGNINEAKEIANDIEENENKINHHGKRADSIVKGMLQHSRQSTGQKEPTDLNALIDEYLKLSYQALRSKDKSFNSAIETNLDKTIGKIQVVPQDIGRVLLNLYNNAFYSVNEKKKGIDKTYEPRVEVTTKKLDSTIEIAVVDNGTGIPQEIVDRIYHPFFTTKPTGEGTGLGLSLSYDIIKAHGGSIELRSQPGDGAAFLIVLPISN